MNERDYSLDCIKGIACIFMILIHAITLVTVGKSNVDGIFGVLAFFGGTAPVLFFAVSGITSSAFQVKKSIKAIIPAYLIFGVLGVSYIGIWRANIYSSSLCDILQMMAMAVIIIVLIEKIIKPSKIFYLVASIAVFLIHYFITSKIPAFPVKDFLFAPAVFPIFPWISMVLLGIFLYRIDKKWNLLIGTSVFVVSILVSMVTKVDFFNKFNMSVGYFAVSIFVMSTVFFISRTIKFKKLNNPILYFGKNSLLFLYVHLLAIKVFAPFTNNVLLRWIAVLILAYLLMLGIQFINRYIEKAFSNIVIWILMIVAVVFIPLFIGNVNLIFSLEMLIGILFSANYHKLSGIIEKTFSHKLNLVGLKMKS
ncbi:heparan-alpha-glucosaminide N-acetyltransferase domain-containing protein [Clostridium neuense]|uniref:Heparan-alpha-glucosaminide N-acetyltransferase domain-containing protein n=1 Tax=Clostridium neuense TaxID=1728934 RepID=A0ABW8TJA5_9CLOT